MQSCISRRSEPSCLTGQRSAAPHERKSQTAGASFQKPSWSRSTPSYTGPGRPALSTCSAGERIGSAQRGPVMNVQPPVALGRLPTGTALVLYQMLFSHPRSLVRERDKPASFDWSSPQGSFTFLLSRTYPAEARAPAMAYPAKKPLLYVPREVHAYLVIHTLLPPCYRGPFFFSGLDRGFFGRLFLVVLSRRLFIGSDHVPRASRAF